MALVHWNPFRELSAFDTPFNRAFRPVALPIDEGSPREWNWTPAVDVYETDDHALVISAELPGMDSKDVSVAIENGVLTISGERKLDPSVDRERWYRSERAYGKFRRSFTLPRTVDAGTITAAHKDGTLQVRLPLKEEAKPHNITVKAA